MNMDYINIYYMGKFQINHIVSGRKRVLIEPKDPKYIFALKSTSHEGYTGSGLKYRQECFNSVLKENPLELNVKVRGENFLLRKHQSKSGKTVWYETMLDPEDYVKITHSHLGLKKNKPNCPYLKLDSDCELYVGNYSFIQYIGTEFLEIL